MWELRVGEEPLRQVSTEDSERGSISVKSC